MRQQNDESLELIEDIRRSLGHLIVPAYGCVFMLSVIAGLLISN